MVMSQVVPKSSYYIANRTKVRRLIKRLYLFKILQIFFLNNLDTQFGE